MRIVTFCCTMLLIAIAWAQWDLLSAAVVSFACFVLLAIETADPSRFYNPLVAEFWLAAFVWLLAMTFLTIEGIRMLRKRPGDRFSRLSRLSRISGSELFLGLLVFISLACPLLVPVDPIVQGDLVTTRLLPPLSRGHRMVSSAGPETQNTEAGFTGLFEQTTTTLLARKAEVFRGTASPAPGKATGSSFLFLLGTDDLGRDVFSRVVYGTQVSLLIGIAAALGAVILGGLIGFAAGMFPGLVDSALMRMTDMVLSIPAIFLVISLVAFLGSSVATLVIALSVTGWMSTARMVRNEVQGLRDREFILSARMLRIPTMRIIFTHILPNVAPLLFVALVLQFSGAVLAEAALGFLGLGVQPPTPTWGNMMGEATSYLAHAWWPGFFPGLLLSGVVIAAHYRASKLEVLR